LMAQPVPARVAILDFGLGNLFSVKQACEYVGLQAHITAARRDIQSADAVILPGVGAFGDAMANLRKLDLVELLRDVAASDTPLMGICLGVQLLMTESYEFGCHQGLGIISGPVVHFDNPRQDGKILKVPQVGWNRIYRGQGNRTAAVDPWAGTPLDGLAEGECMYFVHSYIVQPEDPAVILTTTRYGDMEFCSGLRMGNTFAWQFHPERSGPEGLRMYSNLARLVRKRIRVGV
jgi:imidazole glycerol-phosphate synthase subunit HisH